eukprot:m.818869 g.818869  ORF g.818869 m.818869 type:complete len:224 (+) comp59388_c0_seq134:4408-5079(+)
MGHDPVAASQVSVATMHDVEEAQRHDVLIQTVRKYLEGDSALPADEFRPHLRDLSVSASGLVVYQGREEARLVVPEELRQGLMRMAHDEPIAGHQGVARTMSRLAGQFWWPRIRKDVDAWVAGCSQCCLGDVGLLHTVCGCRSTARFDGGGGGFAIPSISSAHSRRSISVRRRIIRRRMASWSGSIEPSNRCCASTRRITSAPAHVGSGSAVVADDIGESPTG